MNSELPNLSNLRLRISLASVLAITLILLSGLSYYTFQALLNDIKKDINYTLDSIEYTIISEISDAKHIIYGVAASLTQESLTPNNQRLDQLIHNFSSSSNNDRSIPLAGIVLLDQEGIIIANTIMPDLFNRL